MLILNVAAICRRCSASWLLRAANLQKNLLPQNFRNDGKDTHFIGQPMRGKRFI
jgi:predicted Rdx family selenoprotein